LYQNSGIDNKENHVPCQILIKLDSAKLLEADTDLLERIGEEVKTIQKLQSIIKPACICLLFFSPFRRTNSCSAILANRRNCLMFW
jgi:hypothetical protein